MAELTIRPEEIRDALENFVQTYQPDAASREEVGTVSDAADGIAHVEGLPSAMANELLKFEDGSLGLALNLEEREIRWATRSTASARSRPRAAAPSNCRPPRSCSASRCTSPCRPA
jgi:F0F1-type ATP synthase alpha subunit